MFNLPIFLFITPMFLFSGTFFPISTLPDWAQRLSVVFPLYHMVEMTRYFSLGKNEVNILASIIYLTVFFISFMYLALYFMRRRLIK